MVIEKSERVGGVSVHTGTIPSKTLRETALNLSGWHEREFYGQSYRVKQNITAADLKNELHMTLDHEVEVLKHQFARNAVETLNGIARFVFLQPLTLNLMMVRSNNFQLKSLLSL